MAGNKGVPEDDSQAKKGTYFEFHAKLVTFGMQVNLQDDVDEERELRGSGARYHVGTSVNIVGSAVPLLTIRIYEKGRESAMKIKDDVITLFKAKGYHVKGDIQQEFCFHDTFPTMDENWLF